jgi:hypothetical protein
LVLTAGQPSLSYSGTNAHWRAGWLSLHSARAKACPCQSEGQWNGHWEIGTPASVAWPAKPWSDMRFRVLVGRRAPDNDALKLTAEGRGIMALEARSLARCSADPRTAGRIK